MTTLRNIFDGGTDGVTITTGNSGGASGDAFTDFTDTAGGTFVYSTAGAIHGSLCTAFSLGVTSGSMRRGWAVNAGALTTPQFYRCYLDPADFTGAVSPLRGMDTTSATQRWRVQLDGTTRILTFRDSANTSLYASTALTAGVKYRVEVRVEGSTTGTSRVKIFIGEKDNPVQDSGELALANFGGVIQKIFFGQCAAATNVAGKLDSIGWSDTTWLGAVAAVTWQPKLNRKVRYLLQKTVGGEANYVKRRPAIITGFAGNGDPRLRVGHAGEVYGDATTGIARKTNPDGDTVSQYVSY